MDTAIIVALIATLGGGGLLGALLTALLNRNKNKATAERDVSEAYSNLVVNLEQRIKALEQRDREKDEKITALEKMVGEWQERYIEVTTYRADHNEMIIDSYTGVMRELVEGVRGISEKMDEWRGAEAAVQIS